MLLTILLATHLLSPASVSSAAVCSYGKYSIGRAVLFMICEMSMCCPLSVDYAHTCRLCSEGTPSHACDICMQTHIALGFDDSHSFPVYWLYHSCICHGTFIHDDPLIHGPLTHDLLVIFLSSLKTWQHET
jgi:hypothetical protein